MLCNKGGNCQVVTIDNQSRTSRPPTVVPKRLVFMCMRARGWTLERGGTFRP